MAEVVERAQGCFPCHLSGRAVVAAPLGILRDYVQAALLVHAPPPPPQDTAWLPFPSNLEYAAAPPLTQDPAPYSSGLHPASLPHFLISEGEASHGYQPPLEYQVGLNM